MPTRYRYFRGYPHGYRAAVLSQVGCTLGCLPFTLLPLYAAVFYWNVLHGHWRLGPTVGLVLSGLMFLWFVCMLCSLGPKPRILPFFERYVGQTDTWLSGEALARNCRALDEAAAAHGLVPLSEFGYEEAPPGEESEWRDASRGVETARGLAQLVGRLPRLVDDPAHVQVELELLEDALAKASDRGIRFCLHLRCSDFVCPAEITARKGSYF